MPRFRPQVELLPAAAASVPRWLAALRGRPGLVALDSAGGMPRRWSLVGFDPLREPGGAPLALPTSIAGLRELTARLAPPAPEAVPGPFAGGFLGALSYDLGVAGERGEAGDRARRSAEPLVAGGLYTDFVVIDERGSDERGPRAWLVLDAAAADGRPPVAARRRALLERLARAPLDAAGIGPRPLGPLVRRVPSREHRRRIEALRARIARGELYQANLAHPFTRAMAGDPLALYARLRAVNPAPYMGYLEWGAGEGPLDEQRGDEQRGGEQAGWGRDGGALLSASPELLLEVGLDSGGALRARTRPIKGTAPRSADPARDAALARALVASDKDRAELAMIVDLERNDLGRVARPGGVRVAGFPTLESYASVHHLAAEVTAELAAGKDAVDALAALFPGGSITGAPKLAAMAAIAELEREPRGFFTGSLGFLDLAGRAAFNILIRTLVWTPGPGAPPRSRGTVRYPVGGGITWSSDAAAEDGETLAKGAALAAALEAARAAAPSAVAEPAGA